MRKLHGEMIQSASAAARAHVYLSFAERTLRALVFNRLADDDRQGLADKLSAINQDVFVRAQKNWKEAQQRGLLFDPLDDNVLSFYTLSQLRDLLSARIDLVSDVFPTKADLQAVFTPLESARNFVAHNRVLSQDRLEQLETTCTWILEKVAGADQAGGIVDELLPLDVVELLFSERYLDVIGVYSDRGDLTGAVSLNRLLEGAQKLDAAGLSLNLVSQVVSKRKLASRIRDGLHARLMLLDPAGKSIVVREEEEGYNTPVLQDVTKINLAHLQTFTEIEGNGKVEVRLYDETIRLNYYCFDNQLAIVQPYLQMTRGAESPSFVLRNSGRESGLFDLFAEQFEQQWARAYE